MSWDWDTADIDPDKNNGWQWVPITPKMLEDEADQWFLKQKRSSLSGANHTR